MYGSYEVCILNETGFPSSSFCQGICRVLHYDVLLLCGNASVYNPGLTLRWIPLACFRIA